ncbi:hypothetical protein AAY80_209 [Stenotrophomonas phage vB_SmaS-DLP_6]|nr:hypothetical protein AAY80_209 [Stenotrophomonas phage vB_SmaS-DLP_6]
MSEYDATLLEQLEDTEGENEILSLEVERLTGELERIQENAEKKQRQVIAQLVELFPKQKDLSPEAYGAWLAKKVRDLQSDVSQVRRDNQNGYIDVLISNNAAQMYHGDDDGMPDPTDRLSYEAWMRNGMKIRRDAPMKNVYRITKDDLVKEYFTLAEMLRRFFKQRAYNPNNYSEESDEMLYRMAEQNRMSLFKTWLGVQSGYKPPSQRASYDNSIYLSCTPAGRDDCERVLTVLKRNVAKKKEDKKKKNLDWDDEYYSAMRMLANTKMPLSKKKAYSMLDMNPEELKKMWKYLEDDYKQDKTP